MTGGAPSRLRRAAGWLPALILVPATVAGGVALSQPEDDLAAMREEQPLDLGTTWVYDVFDHGKPSGTHTSQVVGTAGLSTTSAKGLTPAAKVRRHYTDYPGQGPRTTTSYLGIDGATMYQYGLAEGGSYTTVEPPLVAYRLPPEKGARWSYDGTVGTNDYRFSVELTEIVDVEVGGHTFEGCAHFVNTIPIEREGEPTIEEVTEEWTCPGYGAVRSVDRVEALDIEVTEELTEFHGVAGNWYADGARPDETPSPDPIPGSTAGFDTTRAYAVDDGTLGRELAWTDIRSQRALLPPASDGVVMVTAEPNGQVSLRTNETGEMRWRVQLTEPILAAPLIAGGTVVVADAHKQVWALSVDDGRALWVRELSDVVSASPTQTDEGIAVATDDGALTMLALADGDTRWKVELGGAARTDPAYDGEQLLVGDRSGTVTSLDPSDGEEQWSQSLDEGLAEGPLVAGDLVLAQDLAGVVHAWTEDGDVAWESRSRGSASAPMAAGNGLVLTTTNLNQVAAFDLDNGERVWTRRLPTVRTNPVIVGDEAAVPTRSGELVVLSLEDGRPVDRWPLPLPTTGEEPFNEVSTALVGDTVVVSGFVGGTLGGTVLYAYPVQEKAPSGLTVSLRNRPLPSLPGEPAVLAGDDVVGGFGQELLRIAPDGTTTRLMTSEGSQTGAAVRDGIVVARQDDTVLGVRLEDGKQLWSAPGGTSAYGAVPALTADTAYFGVDGQGLTAVDLQTGERRWSTDILTQFSVTSPLVLPDGDVVYGGGGLARYDGATGEQEWQDPEAHLFGPASYAGGVVYAVGVGLTGPAGVGAWEAASGRRLWFHEVADAPVFLGPVVADGVVVSTDDLGVVTAYDALTGEELWRVTARNPLGGAPVVRDGHVLLIERVPAPDVVETDVRLSVHDLRTGRFEAAWEPTTAPVASGQPLVGSTPSGDLLYPTYFGLIQVVVK